MIVRSVSPCTDAHAGLVFHCVLLTRIFPSPARWARLIVRSVSLWIDALSGLVFHSVLLTREVLPFSRVDFLVPSKCLGIPNETNQIACSAFHHAGHS